MRALSFGIVLSLCFVGANWAAEEGAKEGARPMAPFVGRSCTTSDGTVLAYGWCEPNVIEEGRRYPLVVALHGAAGRAAFPESICKCEANIVLTRPENRYDSLIGNRSTVEVSSGLSALISV